MRTIKQFGGLLAAGAVLAATAQSSSAQTTEGPITTTTPISFTLTEFNGALLFPQFNPALGVLDSVTLDLTASLSTSLTVMNNASSTSHGTVYTDLQISLGDAGKNFASTAPQLNIAGPVFNYSLGSGQSINSGFLTATGSSANTYTSAAILAEFTGGGDLSLDASSSTWTVLENFGGNTMSSQTTFADLTGTVQYTYIDPPTPSVPDGASTGFLVTVGFSGLAFLRRKFNK